MAKDRIVLKNWNKVQKEVFSADGDSIHIMPDMKTEVDKKFLWSLPKGVEEYREAFTVFGKKTKEVEITDTTGNLKSVSDERKTLSTDKKPISTVESA